MSDFITLKVRCHRCKKEFKISVNYSDYLKFLNREDSIQNCFPYLSPDYRELLLSETCGECYDELFKDIE